MSASSSYPIEITAPAIGAYRRGNHAIDYVHRFVAKEAGAHVLVTALVHGNELCGAIALDMLLKSGLRPRRGTLTLAFCNVAAFERFDAANPSASRFVDEDFNRVWSPDVLDGSRNTVETIRAREIRPIVAEADFLLDIHSMQHATAPLTLCGPLDKGRAWAKRIAFPELIVSDHGHAAGRRMRDYGGFGDPASPKNALLVECGQHWEKAAADVAVETMMRVLVDLGTVTRADAAPFLPRAPRPPARVVEVTEAVTIRTDRFAFAQPFRGLEVLPAAGTLIGHDGDQAVRTPYADCVLIMPSQRLTKGQTAVRLGRFIA
jgi:predicted deacylase